MANDISLRKNLNVRQAEFVKNYVAGGNAHQAALAAGYAEGTARVAGTQLLETPSVARAVALEVRHQLAIGAPAALKTIKWLMQESPSHKVRLDAAKTWLDRVGIIPPRPQEDKNATLELPLHEMSADELRTLAQKFEGELAQRARTVTGVPETPKEVVGDAPDPVDELIG